LGQTVWLVVFIEIDPLTFEFAKSNLEKTGYNDIVLVKEDGTLGYRKMSPYCRIAITAACNKIPPPLIEQLRIGGRLIGPVKKYRTQYLVLFAKNDDDIRKEVVCEVLYVSLRGR
jgi:protein-L-isoaspartate(D-aspartate) O-methyltransferase